MSFEVIGISGSPIKNSNTDRLIKAILDATGAETEFVKLSTINVKPCFACKACVPDNVCKVKDDFPALAEKIKGAKALIIGGYIPYGQIDGFTKALLERFWSLRHNKNLLKGKLCATVLTGGNAKLQAAAVSRSLVADSREAVNKSLATEFREYENMELLGQLTIDGNMPCATCGIGDNCEMSGLKLLGPDVKAADVDYSRAEDQQGVWDEASKIGHVIRERLSSTIDSL